MFGGFLEDLVELVEQLFFRQFAVQIALDRPLRRLGKTPLVPGRFVVAPDPVRLCRHHLDRPGPFLHGQVNYPLVAMEGLVYGWLSAFIYIFPNFY